MNCPSRTDEPLQYDGLNQNPSGLAADLTTRQDLNGIVNTRTDQDISTIPNDSKSEQHACSIGMEGQPLDKETPGPDDTANSRLAYPSEGKHRKSQAFLGNLSTIPGATGRVLLKYGRFIGPGFMVAVAYIDPGNYSTDVAAGAAKRFRLLFIVLMSNIFAIVLQSLAIRLGTITGRNLAENCRAHLPKWLNIILYILGEAAIIATDIAEVIGSAIALNLLLKIPLVAGCAITLVDVLVILLFYNPNGNLRQLRLFEIFVMALVLGVVICFCIELSLLTGVSVGEVFRGYLPSSAVVQGDGIYLSCGILGATVMPHSLYLGSGIVQSRLRHFDIQAGNTSPRTLEKSVYRPSLSAIRSCLSYSIAEVAISLFTFALFVNSSILIVAGASLSSNSAAESADLFGIHSLLAKTIAPAAGTIFALALLLSGTSAGIVCTIAGQMLSEGALNWTIAPWLRRLLTRSISITPSIIIAGAVGKDGLSDALNASQVALSVCLPFVSAPLIYFTCRNRYMKAGIHSGTDTEDVDDENDHDEPVKMRNHWILSSLALVIWLVIVIMNVALLVLVGMGKA
ncbi:uncharacterized protein KY384_004327 [Bacidia gigantensis]|uniref:uncharacterized protein n=1 Tax=Bacidia gigantensis TaxID=2732470 RepID=UPI001D059345|nr:uncharacterized protein KY384_004327 [Bacidia gigantensis]KAG8530970.1 hypothetical protein KY384_004327 [Bacidia gigantensis]